MGKRTGRVYVVTPLSERFWPKVDKTSHPYGCWLWTGSKLTAGYGHIWSYERRQMVLAHRVSYTLMVGEIPELSSYRSPLPKHKLREPGAP